MPRRERVTRTRALVASARSYSPKSKKAKDGHLRAGEEWQRQAWDFFDTIGEYRQAPTIMGALLSRAKLVCYEDGVPTKNEHALAAMAELCGGEEGQAEMLRQYGVHFTVAGEGWLFSPPLNEIPTAEPSDWLVAASTQVSRSAGIWKVNGKELEGERMVIRLWRSHPVDPSKADAPSRAALPVLAELLQLTKRIAAQIDSRLAGAGLLLLPSETSFPASPQRRLNTGDPAPAPTDSVHAGDAQGLADLLFDQAQEAIDDPSSAAAMLPIIGEAPGEYIGNVKHINFWSELDRSAPKLREELIIRIARSMDIPQEVLLGTAGSNHWNAWLSDENSVKIHGEPTLKIITAGLTSKYLRKALDGVVDDPRRFTIGVDTSQMRLRPNRSKEAAELNDRMILSDEAVLRENGFTEADAMTKEGLTRALLRKMASGSTTPEIVNAAAIALGVDLGVEIRDNRPPAEARPTPSLQDHPTRELPELVASVYSSNEALVFASEQLIDRALQRAGNRMKAKMALKDPPAAANRLYQAISVRPGDLDDLLKDAWASISEFDYGVDPAQLTRALDTYTRSVMLSGATPSRDSIARALKLLLNRAA